MRFELANGQKQIVLIEWKYTESYGSSFLKFARRTGTDRTAIYRHVYDEPDFPLDKSLLPHFDTLFYEPFYQLFRQQALAYKMQQAHELDADIVSVLHLEPACNEDFHRITSSALVELAASAIDVWKRLVQGDRFKATSLESLFGQFPIERFPELQRWKTYMEQRYAFLLG